MSSSVETHSVERGALATNGAAKKLWHTSAPQQVRQAFRAGNRSDGWAVWAEHLAVRNEPAPLASLLPDTDSPFGWALPDGPASTATSALLARLQRLPSRPSRKQPVEPLLMGWLAEHAGATPTVGYALGAVGWCHALPQLAHLVSAAAWWELLDHLLTTAEDAAGLDLQEDPLLQQCLAGELGLALAYLLPELAPCRRLAAPARKALSTGLMQLLDGEGLPHGRYLSQLSPLMACWTRCRAMGQQLSQGSWNAEAEGQYQWLVRAALRLTRQDGSQVLSSPSAGRWSKDLLRAALEFGGDEVDRWIAAMVLPGFKKPKGRRGSAPSLPCAANHSEWAAVTVLRPGWFRSEPRLTAVYPGRALHIELASGSEVIWSGRWDTEISSDGQPAEPTSNWEEICWVTDEDADYLELEIHLTGGMRLQRHLLMARQQRFLFVADSLLGERPASLDYRTILPLSPRIAFQPADETHEGFLVGKKRRALVLPLALPEWRCDPRTDRLAATGRGLELQQSAMGRRLFAPLWFDLDARRMTRPFTWRHLTVAENLETLSRDVAVGYRVMVGKAQWLVYRSLAEAANRTLLGHNLSTQMLVGTFADGEVEPLLAIE